MGSSGEYYCGMTIGLLHFKVVLLGWLADALLLEQIYHDIDRIFRNTILRLKILSSVFIASHMLNVTDLDLMQIIGRESHLNQWHVLYPSQ